MVDQPPAKRHQPPATGASRFAFYPGCLVLQRMVQYELATRRLLEALDVTLEDLDEAACCGAPIVESFSDEWVALAAYNLALAERLDLDVVTLCGSCTNTLRRARQALVDPALRERVNARLAPFDLQVSGRVRVKHVLQVLSERRDLLRERVSVPLALDVALTYPCQVTRPAEVAQFDDPLQPRAMHDLVAFTGATIVETGVEWECCGSSYAMSDEELALTAGRRKLEAARGADLLVDSCGNCHLLLERMQRAIWAGHERQRLPVLFLPQLLGLALGLAPEELGLNGVPAPSRVP
jgi:heterodisulfide reductase subunit B